MIQKTRILVFDTDRNDRWLLSLALQSANPEFEVVHAGSLLELMHELSVGPVAAVVGDPRNSLAGLSEAVGFARRRVPGCLLWLFTLKDDEPASRECIGLGIDGRDRKDSSGYLSLPTRLQEHLRQSRDLMERHAEELLTLGTSAVPGAVALVDAEGRFRAVNAELEIFLQRPRYLLLDSSLDLLASDPAARGALREHLSGPRNRTTWTFDLVLEGRPTTCTALLRPVSDTSPRPGFWIASLSEASRVLVSPETAAIEARNTELEQLLFAVTHDLQAPLNSLTSSARWLAGFHPQPNEEFAESAQEMAALTQRMQKMLDGILAVTSVRASPQEPEAASFDGILADAIANLQSDIEAAGATIERQPLPTLVVNRQQMVQVFQNLISNALKFRADRRPRVRINSQDSGDCLRLIVEDNGIGIDPRNAPRIFGMFQRLHTEQEFPGLGIGLAICRQIVRAHGGELFVESVPAGGASFILEFRGPGLRSVINSQTRGEAANR